MAEQTQVAVAAGRSHIIERPRLTRLLDEATSRVILLVAPAGYGKTTLARQWLESRPHAWYRGTPASADVAALAAGLAEATATILPGAGRRMRERLMVTQAPGRDVDVLADLLTEDLAAWPSDAWIAVDDYQFLTGTPEAARFLDSLIDRSRVRFLLATRGRPSWVTARRLLYGEIFELGRAALAMSLDEGQQVLIDRPSDEIPGLLAISEGWPAVLGLAATAGPFDFPDKSVPRTLYDFFAEELFQPLPRDLQDDLAKLAVAPVITAELASILFDHSASTVLAEATRLGVLSARGSDAFDLHPLVHEFLARRLAQLDRDTRDSTLAEAGSFLIAKQEWDEAFAMIERFTATSVLIDLVQAALQPLLTDGRLSTLNRWLGFAAQAHVASPILDLAEAEVAFREGAHAKAQVLALQARAQLGDGHPLVSRALALAGESAYQLDRSEVSLDLHQQAFDRAVAPADRRRASWGQFLAAIQLESERARDLLEDVATAHGQSIDGTLRLATARLLLAATSDSTEHAVQSVRPIQFLVDKSSDAKIRTSFLHLFGSALASTANYAEALEMVDRGKRDALEYRLDFTFSFSLVVEIVARLGLRDFTRAAALLDECTAVAANNHDVFLDMSARTARCKMLLAHGAFDDAIEATQADWPHIPGPVVYGELLGVRALALACGARREEALDLASRAEGMTRGVEALTLAACARSIVASREASADKARIGEAFLTARRTENYDSLVAAVRGEPALLEFGVRSATSRALLRKVLSRSRDRKLASAVGLELESSTDPTEGPLSPREQDVFALLLHGRTNKQIAEALYVSEATVKVHVRHILRKLGVRTRTQAVLKGSAGSH